MVAYATVPQMAVDEAADLKTADNGVFAQRVSLAPELTEADDEAIVEAVDIAGPEAVDTAGVEVKAAQEQALIAANDLTTADRARQVAAEEAINVAREVAQKECIETASQVAVI